jgi:hypothetical protein
MGYQAIFHVTIPPPCIRIVCNPGFDSLSVKNFVIGAHAMKTTAAVIALSIAVTIGLYLAVYYCLPGPTPSLSLVILLAGLSLFMVSSFA